jgi:hypothetical protein
MTNLATYTQIAQLVKSWADKIDNAAGTEYAIVGEVADDMRAFGNGLLGAVDTFAPIIAELNKIVASDNVAASNESDDLLQVELRRAFDGQPFQRNTFVRGAFGWAISFQVPAGHYVVEARYPRKYPPMVPEEV